MYGLSPPLSMFLSAVQSSTLATSVPSVTPVSSWVCCSVRSGSAVPRIALFAARAIVPMEEVHPAPPRPALPRPAPPRPAPPRPAPPRAAPRRAAPRRAAPESCDDGAHKSKVSFSYGDRVDAGGSAHPRPCLCGASNCMGFLPYSNFRVGADGDAQAQTQVQSAPLLS